MMNKETFLKILEENLKHLSEEDKKDIIYDYREHFYLGEKEGQKEEDIAKELGNPKDIALQYSANSYIKEAREEFKVKNIFMAILAFCGLGFLNILIVLPIFMGVLSVIFAGWVIAICVALAGVAVMGVAVLSLFPSIFILSVTCGLAGVIGIFLVGIGTLCLGIICTILMGYLTKFLYNKTLDYLSMNLEIIKQ